MPTKRETVQVRKEINLKSAAGVLLDIDPEKTSKIVGETHTTHRATLRVRGREGERVRG